MTSDPTSNQCNHYKGLLTIDMVCPYCEMDRQQTRIERLSAALLTIATGGAKYPVGYAAQTLYGEGDSSAPETPTELQRAKELVAWLPITTEELIRLRNANKITFDKQVNSITTVLIQLRELFADSPVETAAPETSCRYEAAVGSVCNKCGRIHDFGSNRCAECQTPRLCGVERECLRNRYVRPSVQETSGKSVEEVMCPHGFNRLVMEAHGHHCAQCKDAEKASAQCPKGGEHYWHTDGYCVKCELSQNGLANGDV